MSEGAGVLQMLPETMKEIRSIAQSAGLPIEAGETTAQLRRRVAEHLSKPEVLFQLLQGLDADALGMLSALTWHAQGVIPGRVLDHYAQPPPYRQPPRQVCESLAARGLLFERERWIEYAPKPGYRMSSQNVVTVSAYAATLLAARTAPAAVLSEQEGRGLGAEFLGDLVRVHGEMARRPASISQQGLLYKRDTERLERVLSPRDLGSISPAWAEIEERYLQSAHLFPTPWQEDASTRLGLLLWLGNRLGITEVNGDVLAPVHDWDRKLERAGAPKIWLNALSLVRWVHSQQIAQAALLSLLHHETWLLLDRLLGAIEPYAEPFFSRLVPGVASLLVSFGRMGALEAALLDGSPAVRLSAAGRWLMGSGHLPAVPGEDTVQILPSGDILVPPFLRPHLQARLERFAHPERVDIVTTYRLEQPVIAKAVEAGEDPQKILATLTSLAKDGLPQPVRFRLEEWVSALGRFEFLEVALLVAASAADAQRALSVRSVRDAVQEVLADRFLVIAADDEEKIRKALERQGITVRRAVRRPSGLASEKDLRRRDQLLGRDLRQLDAGPTNFFLP